MYKLLLVTEQKEIQDLFQHQIDWAAINCRAPLLAASAQEAIEMLNSKAIDAVGYHLPKDTAAPLVQFLRYGRPSLPIFEVSADQEKQTTILGELVRVLNRLHADFSDDYYDEDAMLTLQRDELVRNLLAGQVHDYAVLERELKLIRSRIDPARTGLLYEIDLPQGDVYLSEHHGHAQQRLESALRNNFFGRYVDGIGYAVAVLTPRHIRLVCMPMQSDIPEEAEAFARRADDHVHESIQNIKEYLDLDMTVIQTLWLDGLKELLTPAQPE